MAKKEQEIPVGIIARALVRRSRSATLATALTGRRQGWPYASLVTVAFATDASPVLLLSGLADHTRNLAEDPRASLLFEEASGLANPQTGPRVTLTGKLRRTKDQALARRFLARHPGAELYAGFADFGFFRMKVERAHYVGGFGRANWLAAKKFLFDPKASEALATAEPKLLQRLNEGPSDILTRVTGKSGKKGVKPWTVCGLDPEGLDLVRRNTFRRVDFNQPVRTGRGVQGEIRNLLKK